LQFNCKSLSITAIYLNIKPREEGRRNDNIEEEKVETKRKKRKRRILKKLKRTLR